MITNVNLSNDIKNKWFSLHYSERVDLFSKLVDLSNRLSVPVRIYYNEDMGFYVDYREDLTDEVIGLFGFNDLHNNMPQQYLAFLFLSTLDCYLKS